MFGKLLVMQPMLFNLAIFELLAAENQWKKFKKNGPCEQIFFALNALSSDFDISQSSYLHLKIFFVRILHEILFEITKLKLVQILLYNLKKAKISTNLLNTFYGCLFKASNQIANSL